MTQSSAPDRHHESDSTHRPGARLPAAVSGVHDADRGTRLGVGTRVLTAVVAAPLRIVRRLGQISRAAVHLVRARRSVDRSSLCRRRATAGKCALARRATSRAHHHVVRAVPAYPLGADGHVHCPTAARVRQGARQGCGCVRSRCSVAGRAGRTGRAVDRRGHRRSCAARAVRHQRRDRAGPRAARTRHRRRNRCRGPTRDACRRVQCALHDRGLPEPLPPEGRDNRRCDRHRERRRAWRRGTRRRTRTRRSHPRRLLRVDGEALAEDPQRTGGHRGGDRRADPTAPGSRSCAPTTTPRSCTRFMAVSHARHPRR